MELKKLTKLRLHSKETRHADIADTEGSARAADATRTPPRTDLPVVASVTGGAAVLRETGEPLQTTPAGKPGERSLVPSAFRRVVCGWTLLNFLLGVQTVLSVPRAAVVNAGGKKRANYVVQCGNGNGGE